MNTARGQNAEMFNIEESGIYSYRCALDSQSDKSKITNQGVIFLLRIGRIWFQISTHRRAIFIELLL